MIPIRRWAGWIGLTLGILSGRTAPARAQPSLDDYRRAEGFLPANAAKLFRNTTVEPNWLADGSRFWFVSTTPSGTREFLLVDPTRATTTPAFDHARLAVALARAGGQSAPTAVLPFDTVAALIPGTSVMVPVDTTYWRCDLTTYVCANAGRAPVGAGIESLSPDGNWIGFARDHDFRVQDRVGGQIKVSSQGGSSTAWYGTGVPSPLVAARLRGADGRNPVLAFWSPDSRRVATYRIDVAGVRRLELLQSVRADSAIRPEPFPYVYPLPGDSTVARAHLVIFDLETARSVEIQLPPVPVLYYGLYPTLPTDHWWSEDGRRFYVVRWLRGYRRVEIAEVDPTTGAARIVAQDESPTFVERYYQRTVVPPGPDDVLWLSERDGWRHLYRYDRANGQIRSPVTKGSWTVREVLSVDWRRGWCYLTGGGREPNRDPYYRHLYRVRLDGSDPELLTPEAADHQVFISPSGQYIVDTYATVAMPARTVVRSSRDGRVLMEIGTADLSGLEHAGWKPPRQFQVKARDGSTDLYGILVLPTRFDSTKRYPIVDFIYAGPQGAVTPKVLGAAAQLWQTQALAELGFVVMVMDGMGTPLRSKAFHDVAYGNLGDAGLPDHIGAVRQLAARHAFIDTTRVGIFGISAGGYASTHAILAYPDFYKVAVSAAGNHDHRLDKAGWVERYMGPLGPHYREQANATIAGRLEGKLLLAHGDMDENVPLASTLGLVDALVAAGKRFDLLILPNRTHGLDADPYMVRRRWDFFVRHLLGGEPPAR